MTKRAYIEVFQAQKSGIVWASEMNGSWATTGYAYRPTWTHKASSDISALLRLGSALAQRLNAMTLLAEQVQNLMDAATNAGLGDGEWHKDIEICRENLAGRY